MAAAVSSLSAVAAWGTGACLWPSWASSVIVAPANVRSWMGALPPSLLRGFGLHVSLLATFHLGEWAWAAACDAGEEGEDTDEGGGIRASPRGERQRRGGGFSSLLLFANYPEYQIALAAAAAEWALGAALAPRSKSWMASVTLPLGAALAVGGLALRASAMWTARSHFSHVLQARRAQGHELVTHGVYAIARHPAYLGWGSWAVGSQLLLANPLCTVLYAAATWHFFRGRIEEEERALLRFYGSDYVAYAARTPVWIPGIGPTPADRVIAEAAAASNAGTGRRE